MEQLKVALNDLKMTLRQYAMWWHLGCMEVKQRYRRSILGPWWITISLAIFVMMMGIVFSRLFQQSLDEYLPFFTAGFVCWTFLCNGMIEATEIFKVNVGFIKQIHLPYHVYLFKHVVKHLIFMLHNLVVYAGICLFFHVPLKPASWLMFPAFLILTINLMWMSLIIGLICARFRDVIAIVTSCMQVAFFVTPISWMPRLLDANARILRYNPFVYLLDVVRSPMLGNFPEVSSWTFSIYFSVVGCLVSFLIFSKVRSRIAFWVD